MPANPVASPTVCERLGGRCNISEAIAAAKIGNDPFRRPVSPDAIRCSARGNNVNGIATHRNEIATNRGRSSRSTLRRAAGTSHNTAAPKRIRSHVISPGPNDSRPIAMNRNDDPQMAPIAPNNVQSRGVNAPRCVPSLVVSRPRRPLPP